MSNKTKRFQMVMTPEIHQALREVAASEGKAMSAIVHELLDDVLIGQKYVRVPVVGVVMDDELLGNRIIPFPVAPDLPLAVTTNDDSEAAA